jgi:RimJ/RimL family protein N-acetyltransferase
VLHGELVTLREFRRDDLPVVHTAVDSDPQMYSTARSGPWRPVTLAQLQAEHDRGLAGPPDPTVVLFAVQRRDDPAGRCLGWAVLSGLDQHQRTAQLGVGLSAQARGKGLGRDAVRVLCTYAFDVRDLHRVSIGTLATNEAMQAAAVAAGFTLEGRLRENAWVLGRRVDELVFGLLAAQWRQR